MKYVCTVSRMQVWRGIEVEAESESEAKNLADEAVNLGLELGDEPDDDYAYETIARKSGAGEKG